jgi:Uma2 family endonuclease
MATHETHSGSQLELGPDDAGRPVSAEEFADAVYKEPWRYERVKGRLVVLPPDDGDHVETASPWLQRLIIHHIDHREVVHLVVPNVWIRLDEATDRIGDLGVYLSRDPSAKRIPDRIPDLVFEIVGPGRVSHDRDYVEKRSEYERLGVKEYVVVDRKTKQVTVFTMTPDGYRAQVLATADTYTSPLLPGLAIDLDEVFNP